MDLDRLRGRLVYQALLLGAVALTTSGALALASRVTGPEIRAAEVRDLRASLRQVLPGDYDDDLLADPLRLPAPEGDRTVYRARRAGRVEAVVFPVTGRGYAGAIVSVLGVDREGRLLGVRVVQHSETPGLGDRIEARKAPWVLGFTGRSLGDPPPERWAVRKDGGAFDQFTGATVTPRAVVAAVRGGLEWYAQTRSRLLEDTGDHRPEAPAARPPAPGEGP